MLQLSYLYRPYLLFYFKLVLNTRDKKYIKQAGSQRGGLGDLSSPFHPKILQFSRVFEKKP